MTTSATFPCGCLRTPENTYSKCGGRKGSKRHGRCRSCFLAYMEMRRQMIADGTWESRDPLKKGPGPARRRVPAAVVTLAERFHALTPKPVDLSNDSDVQRCRRERDARAGQREQWWAEVRADYTHATERISA